MNRLDRRLAALESRKGIGFDGPGIWIVLDPGETSDDGVARYEAEHGECQPGQPVIIWKPYQGAAQCA